MCIRDRYRFDPRKVDQPFQLDSKKLKSELKVFIESQLRFKKLSANKEWVETLSKHLKHKFKKFQEMAMSDYEKLDYIKEKKKKKKKKHREKKEPQKKQKITKKNKKKN
eukprot:TRINITY_DN12542_c0_g1_i1.p3 TRINITY_DN12542_c0_g1~~TRINITY_DN12542_c0_g1_i1.p3  ORF type:complete len:109 (-),score=43.61 TRINITY_DN12542_c0_g1_i1:26-352(-)